MFLCLRSFLTAVIFVFTHSVYPDKVFRFGVLDEVGTLDLISLEKFIVTLNDEVELQNHVIEEDSKYNIYSSSYESLKSVCDLMHGGSSVVLAAVSCSSALLLQSWAREHKIPTLIFPSQLCSPINFMDEMTVVLHTERSEYYRPTFELVQLLRGHEVAFILDEFHFESFDVGSVASNYKELKTSTVMVYHMNEVHNLFQSRKHTSDVYVLMGSADACQSFFKNIDSSATIFKITYYWVIACQVTDLEHFLLPKTFMAELYAINSSENSRPQRKKNSLNDKTIFDLMVQNVTANTLTAYLEIADEINPNKAQQIKCHSKQTFEHGEKLMESIKSKMVGEGDQFGALSQNVFFVHAFDIEKRNWNMLGAWDRYHRMDNIVRSHINKLRSLPEINLRVVTVVEPPFVFKGDVEDTSGNYSVKYSGYCIELFQLIVSKLNKDRTELGLDPIEYRLYDVTQYGSFIDEKWTGAVGELVYGKADIAISGMIITSSRQDVVDFSSRYMDYSVGIIIRKSENTDSGFEFLDPLDTHVWACFGGAVIAIGLLLGIVTMISPSADSLNQLSGFTDRSTFGLRNSIWFTVSSFMMQGVDMQPSTAAGRILGTFWWFFSLTVTAMYMANLAAFLTVNRMSTPIDSLQSLAHQNKISYGTVNNSPIHLDFMEQADMIPLYEQISITLGRSSEEKSMLVENAQLGYERVARENYAFMWDDPILQWIASRHCEYMTVGKPFMNKGYGFALSKGSPLKENISSAILKLQEEGRLDALKQTWFFNSSECITGKNRNSQEDGALSKGIEFRSVQGIFFLLIIGALLSFLVAALEISFHWFWNSRCSAYSTQNLGKPGFHFENKRAENGLWAEVKTLKDDLETRLQNHGGEDFANFCSICNKSKSASSPNILEVSKHPASSDKDRYRMTLQRNPMVVFQSDNHPRSNETPMMTHRTSKAHERSVLMYYPRMGGTNNGDDDDQSQFAFFNL